MRLEVLSDQRRLQARRAQLIEVPGGVLVKRGRLEVKVGGQRAAEVLQTVLLAAAGGATLDELCERFAAPDRAAVEGLVQALEDRGILAPVEGATAEGAAPESSLDVFYWHFGEPAAALTERLNARPIAILGVNCVSRQLALALRAAGVRSAQVVDYPLLGNLRLFADGGTLAPEAWPGQLEPPREYGAWLDGLDAAAAAPGCLVATSDFGGLQLLRPGNEFCVRRGYHFLPVVLQDMIGYVGPLVVPGETPCFECLRARQNAHLSGAPVQRAAEAVAFEGQAIAGFHPSMASILGDVAALELTKFFAGWSWVPRAVGTVIEVNLLATEVQARKVLKVPRCAVCGRLNARGAVALDRTAAMPGHQEHEQLAER